MRLSLGILAFGLCAAQAAASKVGNKTPQIASPQDVRNTLDRVTSYAQLFAQVSTKSVNGSRTKGHTSEPAKRSEQGKGGSCVINSQKNSTGSRKTGKERRELSKRTGNTGFANTAINWECPGYTFGANQYVPAFDDAILALTADAPFTSRPSTKYGARLDYPLPIDDKGRSYRYEDNDYVPKGCKGIDDPFAYLYQFPIRRSSDGRFKKFDEDGKATNDMVVVASNYRIRWNKRTIEGAERDYDNRRIDTKPYVVACGIVSRWPTEREESFSKDWRDCNPVVAGRYEFSPQPSNQAPYDLPQERYEPEAYWEDEDVDEPQYPDEYDDDDVVPSDDGSAVADSDSDRYYDSYFQDGWFMPEHCSRGGPNNRRPQGGSFPQGPPSRSIYPPQPPRGGYPEQGGPPRQGRPPQQGRTAPRPPQQGMSKAARRYTPGNLQAY